MATIVNARDVLLQAAGTRFVTTVLTGTLDFASVTGATKPANNADVTSAAVNSGVTATAGGVTLSGGGAIKGGKTDYAAGTGFFLGYSGGAYKFDIGSSTSYLRWTGSALSLIGDITGASNIDVTGNARFRGSYTLCCGLWRRHCPRRSWRLWVFHQLSGRLWEIGLGHWWLFCIY